MEDMPQLKMAEHLTAETGLRYRETSSLLRVALQAACADFQPDRYVKVLFYNLHSRFWACCAAQPYSIRASTEHC